MPNTPVIVLHGVTVYTLGQNINEEDRESVDELLSSVGVGMEMQEHYMDIMTGLTGGGPSFVSQFKATFWMRHARSEVKLGFRLAPNHVLHLAQASLNVSWKQGHWI